VIVGSAPNQKRFTVHYKIIERSKFLRTADKSKPIDLHEHEPETFDRYLYCVYRNEMPKYIDQPQLWATLSPWSHWDTNGRNYVSSINLYVLTGILVDPVTQNLVIDDTMRWAGGLGIVPRAEVVHLAFRSTVEGDRLRNFLADTFIYSVNNWWCEDFSNDFLLLVLRRMEDQETSGNVSGVRESHRIVNRDSVWARSQYF